MARSTTRATSAAKLAASLVQGLESRHREPTATQREAWMIRASTGRKRVVASLLVQRDGERLRLQVRAPELVKRFSKVLTPTRSAGEWAGWMLVSPENRDSASEILKFAAGRVS